MPDNIGDTPVEEVIGEEIPSESPAEKPAEADTPPKNEEVESLQREISRLRAAQSASDKRASEEARRSSELEAQTKKAAYGEDEVAYWKDTALENAKKAAEAELKIEVSNLLDEYRDLPVPIKEAIKANPLGFIGNAQDVPTAVINISSYLSGIQAKSPAPAEEKPSGKEFPVPAAAPRASTPTGAPKTWDSAGKALAESGLFS